MKKNIFIIIINLIVLNVSAQTFQSLIREGCSFYQDKTFADSEVSFQKALAMDSLNFIAKYDLGNAQYKQAIFIFWGWLCFI